MSVRMRAGGADRGTNRVGSVAYVGRVGRVVCRFTPARPDTLSCRRPSRIELTADALGCSVRHGRGMALNLGGSRRGAGSPTHGGALDQRGPAPGQGRVARNPSRLLGPPLGSRRLPAVMAPRRVAVGCPYTVPRPGRTAHASGPWVALAPYGAARLAQRSGHVSRGSRSSQSAMRISVAAC